MAHSPEPWRWAKNVKYDGTETKDDCDLGGFMDAQARPVCQFGNAEMYYPTIGIEPSQADIDRILACVNGLAGVPNEDIAEVVRYGLAYKAMNAYRRGCSTPLIVTSGLWPLG